LKDDPHNINYIKQVRDAKLVVGTYIEATQSGFEGLKYLATVL